MNDRAALGLKTLAAEAEQSVLGGLLLDNDAVDRIGDLRAEHFASEEHRVIFTETLALLTAGKPADVITVFDALRVKSYRTDLLPYLNALAQNTPSAANIKRYAEIVRDRAIKREIVALGNELEGMVAQSEQPATEILDTVGARIEKLAEARIKSDPVLARDDLGAHLALIEARESGTIKAIPTGFPDVDRKLNGGIRRGNLIVLAARPAMGKSAFALNVACNIAVDYSVLVLTLEMSRSELHDRNIAALGKLPLPALLQPATMRDEDWPSVTHAVAKINDLNLWIDDQGGIRLMDVRMKARHVKRRHGLDLVVIDYLQLMEGQGDNRNAQIEGITRGLKALAKELDIGIILLSQLNRKLEDRPNKRPQQADLRDSGSIEQDADAILFLYRDEIYNPDSQDIGMCEVDVAKNRQGAAGRVLLTYIGEQTRFESSARSCQPAAPKAQTPRHRAFLDSDL